MRLSDLSSELVAAATPGEALRAASALRRELDALERDQVVRALSEGATFAMIARDLGWPAKKRRA
jgi:hypothetical protein